MADTGELKIPCKGGQLVLSMTELALEGPELGTRQWAIPISAVSFVGIQRTRAAVAAEELVVYMSDGRQFRADWLGSADVQRVVEHLDRVARSGVAAAPATPSPATAAAAATPPPTTSTTEPLPRSAEGLSVVPVPASKWPKRPKGLREAAPPSGTGPAPTAEADPAKVVPPSPVRGAAASSPAAPPRAPQTPSTHGVDDRSPRVRHRGPVAAPEVAPPPPPPDLARPPLPPPPAPPQAPPPPPLGRTLARFEPPVEPIQAAPAPAELDPPPTPAPMPIPPLPMHHKPIGPVSEPEGAPVALPAPAIPELPPPTSPSAPPPLDDAPAPAPALRAASPLMRSSLPPLPSRPR